MISNSNQSLYSVWGTSASSVWAVGNGGTALYYNGIQWQARPTPQQVQGDTLMSLSGTGDNNIFAVGIANGLNSSASGTSVIRFDGTSWSFLGRVSGRPVQITRGLRGRLRRQRRLRVGRGVTARRATTRRLSTASPTAWRRSS